MRDKCFLAFTGGHPGRYAPSGTRAGALVSSVSGYWRTSGQVRAIRHKSARTSPFVCRQLPSSARLCRLSRTRPAVLRSTFIDVLWYGLRDFQTNGYAIVSGLVSDELAPIQRAIESVVTPDRGGARVCPGTRMSRSRSVSVTRSQVTGPWSVKAGIDHAQAPATILEQMVAVRVHLDPSMASNARYALSRARTPVDGSRHQSSSRIASNLGRCPVCAAWRAARMRPFALARLIARNRSRTPSSRAHGVCGYRIAGSTGVVRNATVDSVSGQAGGQWDRATIARSMAAEFTQMDQGARSCGEGPCPPDCPSPSWPWRGTMPARLSTSQRRTQGSEETESGSLSDSRRGSSHLGYCPCLYVLTLPNPDSDSGVASASQASRASIRRPRG